MPPYFNAMRKGEAMPTTTPELAWWVMTGAIAALLSLITLMVAIIGYLIKSGFERLYTRFDSLQDSEALTKQDVAVTKQDISDHKTNCKERHEKLELELATLKK
jgi:hypothetical protein